MWGHLNSRASPRTGHALLLFSRFVLSAASKSPSRNDGSEARFAEDFTGIDGGGTLGMDGGGTLGKDGGGTLGKDGGGTLGKDGGGTLGKDGGGVDFVGTDSGTDGVDLVGTDEIFFFPDDMKLSLKNVMVLPNSLILDLF